MKCQNVDEDLLQPPSLARDGGGEDDKNSLRCKFVG